MEELQKIEQEIKEEVQKVIAPIVQEVTISFDAWFAARKKAIPAHHYKEIILADMKARGTSLVNTMANFDAALAKYGIKLK